MLWDLEIANTCPDVSVFLTATDIDTTMLARARKACFEITSLRELPPYLVAQAFDRAGDLYCVKPRHREGIEFLHQDLRTDAPVHSFDLILCRNVVFTYFSMPVQKQVLARMLDRLLPGGYLAIGTHENLPSDGPILSQPTDAPQIFQKADTSDDRDGPGRSDPGAAVGTNG